MNELLVRLNIFEANNLPRSEFIVTLLREINEIAFVPLSLSFDFVFSSEIFKSLSFRLDRLCHLAILCLDQHAHTLHHLESLLTISLDRLDIFEGRSCISEFVRNLSMSMCPLDYALETAARILNISNLEGRKNTIREKARSGSLDDLEFILEEYTHPSINTSSHHEDDDLEIDEPQSDIIPIRRVDYEETFSPVIDTRAIRILIALAAYYDYEIWKMVSQNAFLNGTSFDELRGEIMSLSSFLYVEDMLIMGNHIPMLQDVKSYLGRCFAMKYLGEAAYILGIKIYIDRSWQLIGLCQSAYIEKIMKRFYMENSKHGSIPMQERLKLSKSQGASTQAEMRHMQNVPYASAVGSIMYAVRCTRPDVAFAQNITSRFQQNACDLHWTTAKNIRKYVRNTKDMFLVYEVSYVFILNGGVVDWKSIKQSIFTTSSAEAEYIAAFGASKEAVWARKFISELGIVPTIEEPINMYCDNTGAIAIANESRITKGARHFRAKVHYLRNSATPEMSPFPIDLLLDELLLDRIEQVEENIEGLVNGRVIIQLDLTLATNFKKPVPQIAGFRDEQKRNNDEIVFARVRFSYLEMIIEDNQVRIDQYEQVL
ncbi:retrotransposon protein, putative, ty1-copia subclass [Tanacetum coccineum]